MILRPAAFPRKGVRLRVERAEDVSAAAAHIEREW
jgi:hypothetical protein